MKIRHLWNTILIVLTVVLLTACGSGHLEPSEDADSVLGSGSSRLRILSGSENKELEPILETYAKENKIQIEMTYQGSLDIMRTLEQETIDYDAVWPASSMWISLGDTSHRVKHSESISISPVVFGIRKSIAEKLGFVGKEVSIQDLLNAIEAGTLKFCMTSATQSNSGASAYIGFLYALLGNPDMITMQDLDDEKLQTEITSLLSGVDRSSGSSDWLKDMFLEGNYDAMVNYECLMISANEALTEQGEEPLYVVYPYDGLSIADSPLGYIDQGDNKAEDRFLKLQKYMLSDKVQNEIQRTGRRCSYTGVSEENMDVFPEEWGLQPQRILSPIKMPAQDVLLEALNRYQTEFKKPSLNIYCLDYSGSMYGEGNEQLTAAMEQLLIQENAKTNFLQASQNEVNILIPFNSDVITTFSAEGAGSELEALYQKVAEQEVGGGTDIYAAIEEGMKQLQAYDLSQYSPAIILLTDGQSSGSYDRFAESYQTAGKDIPIFSIMFGDADSEQLDEIANLTNARVFDGRTDLTAAFRQVKGYN